MSVSVCSRLAELLAGRDGDHLSGAEQRLLSAHLASCPACAAEALRHDPILLFSRDVASDELTAEARERFVGDVLASAGAAKASRRLGVVHARTGLRIAASLLLAAVLLGVWFARSLTTHAPLETPSPVVIAKETHPAPTEAVPAVEEIGGSGTVVYQFPATTPGEPTVVFVVDRNADI